MLKRWKMLTINNNKSSPPMRAKFVQVKSYQCKIRIRTHVKSWLYMIVCIEERKWNRGKHFPVYRRTIRFICNYMLNGFSTWQFIFLIVYDWYDLIVFAENHRCIMTLNHPPSAFGRCCTISTQHLLSSLHIMWYVHTCTKNKR